MSGKEEDVKQRQQSALGLLLVPFRDRGMLLAISVAAALRLAWLVWVPTIPHSDGQVYDVHARTLAQHGIYGWSASEPSSHWPPGTSFLYSVAYRLFGHAFEPIELLNLVLGVGVVYFSVCLSISWFGVETARRAAMILALWPSSVLYTTVLASELPFMFLMLGALVLRTLWPSKPIASGLAVGSLTGAATYFRMEGLLLPLVLAIANPPRAGRAARIIFGVVAMTTVVAITLPWAARNTRLYDESAFLVTSSGGNLWMGNNPDADGSYMPTPQLPGMSPPQKDRYLRAEAVKYIIDNPLRFVSSSLKKVVQLHSRETIAWTWSKPGLETVAPASLVRLLKYVGHTYWLLILALGVAGLAMCLRRNGWGHLRSPSLLVWMYITSIHAVTIAGQDRFHFPSVPFIAMYAAIAVNGLFALVNPSSRMTTLEKKDPSSE